MVTIGSGEAAEHDAATGDGRAPARPSRSSVNATIVVGVLLVLLLSTILLRPGGRRLSDDTEHVERTTVLPFLRDGDSLTQTFRARDDGLSQVMVRFATGDGVEGCRVRVRVHSSTSVVGERQAVCSDLVQAEIFAVTFPPITASDGDDFELEVQVSGVGSSPMSLWGGPSLGTLPVARLDGDALELSAELHTAYGNDRFAWQQIGTALDRIAGYGPFWHEPVVVVPMAITALGCLVALVRRHRRLGIVLVVTFAVVKGVLWSTVLPPLEGPDEHAHFAYAQFMAEQHRIPRRDHDQFGIDRPYSEQLDRGMREVYHQWSQWPGNRADFSAAGRDQAHELMRGLSLDAGGAGAAAGYSPYYYAPAAALYWLAPTDLDQQLGAMRLWSVALGAIAAWLGVLIGRRLFPGSEAAAVAVGVAIAAQPMLSQQAAIVNNDALVVVAGFAGLLVALELAQPAAHRRLLVLGGLATGMAFATKPFGIAWAPVLAVAWLIGRWRTPSEQRRSWIGDGLRAGVGVAATYGLWIALSTVLDLPASAVQTFNPEPGPKTLRRFIALQTQDLLKPLRDRWIEQFWGSFGGLTLPLPKWVLSTITTVTVLSLLALVVWAVALCVRLGRRRLRAVPGDELSSVLHIALCTLSVVVTLSVLHVADFLQYRRNGRLELLQGRYALMVLPAVLALPALLVARIGGRSWAARAMVVIAAAVVALNVLSVSLMVERYYL